MTYKDKSKQREAVKQAVRRHRQRKKGITTCNTQGQDVIPRDTPVEIDGETWGQRRDKIILDAFEDKPEPQSHNRMMVGYVPPKGE